MKAAYSLTQQFTAYILLSSLFLQSCRGLGDTLIPINMELKTSTEALLHQITPQLAIQPLIGQELVAQGGHIVTFYQDNGKLKADVAMNAPKGFSKTYRSVNVNIEKGTKLASLPHLSKQAQQYRIHLQLAKGEQPAKVIVYKGAGLMGGMLEGEEEAGKTGSNDNANNTTTGIIYQPTN
jgi:hypothetical protein